MFILPKHNLGYVVPTEVLSPQDVVWEYTSKFPAKSSHSLQSIKKLLLQEYGVIVLCYGAQFLQGTYPFSMASSRVLSSTLFFSFILLTEGQLM